MLMLLVPGLHFENQAVSDWQELLLFFPPKHWTFSIFTNKGLSEPKIRCSKLKGYPGRHLAPATPIYLKGSQSPAWLGLRGWAEKTLCGQARFRLFDLSVCICGMKEPLFSWQAARLGDDASGNLHEMDVVVLSPLAEWKGCLFCWGLGLCI